MSQRLSYAFLLLAMIGLAVAFAQENGNDVRKLLADQVNAWNAGDIDGYMKGYWKSDSTEFVSGGSVTRGYRNVLARYKKSYNSRAKMGKLEFSELLVRTVAPQVAIATGVWRLTRLKDQPWGRFTLILEQKPEGWRIVYDHTSSEK
jgi:beta-aspartyl-peptidase (threonine type)